MRMMLVVVVVLLVAGCSTPQSTGRIEYVGGTDPHPGIPADAEAPPDPSENPTSTTTERPKCTLLTEIAQLKTLFGNLPPGVSEDAAFNAALQFLITSGESIDSQDRVAHTIVTRRFNGQTWLSSCPIDHYFMYAIRIAITGTNMIVNMECWTSIGWEASIINGVSVPRNRGELAACDVPAYVSKGDAALPSMIFEGTLQVIDLRRMSNPDPLPPPSLDAIRTARWWCAKLSAGDAGGCYRSRDECERRRREDSTPAAVLSDCFPMRSATCFEMQTNDRDRRRFSSCHPSIGACISQLKYAGTRPEVRIN